MNERVLIPLIFLAGAAAAWPQAHTQTTTADITASEMVFRFQKSEFEFTGNCVLKISGANTAEMYAPRMVFQLTSGGTQLKHLTAYGPTKVTVMTPKNEEGQRRKIVAECKEYATFNEPEQMLETKGDTVVDVLILPEGPDSQRLRFNMNEVRINLRTGELTGKPARVHFEGFLPAGEAEEGKQ